MAKSTKQLAKELGLLRKRPVSVSSPTCLRKKQKNDQPFSHLIIIDFESTCWENDKLRPQEIIEFPAVLLNIATGELEDEFHHYVQPSEFPVLSSFCQQLTGISQDTVDEGIPLSMCLRKFVAWLRKLREKKSIVCVNERGSSPSRSLEHVAALVTWSDWDLGVCLLYEARRKQITRPVAFNSWIDLRATYRKFYSRRPEGLNGALNELGIEFEGRQHSGLDDAKNTARLAWRMVCDGCIMATTKSLKTGKQGFIERTSIPPATQNIPGKSNLQTLTNRLAKTKSPFVIAEDERGSNTSPSSGNTSFKCPQLSVRNENIPVGSTVNSLDKTVMGTQIPALKEQPSRHESGPSKKGTSQVLSKVIVQENSLSSSKIPVYCNPQSAGVTVSNSGDFVRRSPRRAKERGEQCSGRSPQGFDNGKELVSSQSQCFEANTPRSSKLYNPSARHQLGVKSSDECRGIAVSKKTSPSRSENSGHSDRNISTAQTLTVTPDLKSSSNLKVSRTRSLCSLSSNLTDLTNSTTLRGKKSSALHKCSSATSQSSFSPSYADSSISAQPALPDSSSGSGSSSSNFHRLYTQNHVYEPVTSRPTSSQPIIQTPNSNPLKKQILSAPQQALRQISKPYKTPCLTSTSSSSSLQKPIQSFKTPSPSVQRETGSFKTPSSGVQTSTGSFKTPSPGVQISTGSFKTPSSGVQTSSGSFKTPSLGVQTSSGSFKTPSSGVQTSSGSFKTPSSGVQTSFGSFKTPSPGVQTSSGSFKTPSSGVQTSTGSFKTPSSGVQTSAGSFKTPSPGVQTSSGSFKTPSPGVQTSSGSFKTPSPGVQISTGSFKTPSSGVQTSSGSFKTPSLGVQTSSGSFKTPSSGVQTSSGSFKTPSSGVQTSFGSFKTPSPGVQTSSGSFKTPSSGVQTSTGSFKTPSSGVQTSAGSFKTPSPGVQTSSGSFKTPSPGVQTSSGSFKTPLQTVRSVSSSMKATPPLCLCGRRSKRRQVQNCGPNMGRLFFTCSIGQPAGSTVGGKGSCGFFQWESPGEATRGKLIPTQRQFSHLSNIPFSRKSLGTRIK